MLKSVFVVEPGADHSQIALQYDGYGTLSINEKGELVIETPLGTIVDAPPVAFTEDGQWVNVAYRLDGRTVSFLVDSYDTNQVLYIDPSLIFSRQFGSSLYEYTANAMLESATSRYIGGLTYNSSGGTEWQNKPGGGVQPTHAGGSYDLYICKFNLANDVWEAFTFIGGNSTDYGAEMAFAGSDILIAGTTSTSSGNIANAAPITPVNTTSATTTRAMVVRLNSTISALTASPAWFSGNSSTQVGALAYDPGTQSVYVGGTTCATSGLGPAASGYQSTNYSSGCYDGFVTRLTSTLATATNMTYLGGSYYDGIAGLRVDASGNVYAAGATYSGTSYSWPFATTIIGGTNGISASSSDWMISKLNNTLTAIGTGWSAYTTRIGGTGYDGIYYPYSFTSISIPDSMYPLGWDPIEVDSTGRVFMGGFTSSTDYPTTGSPWQALEPGRFL